MGEEGVTAYGVCLLLWSWVSLHSTQPTAAGFGDPAGAVFEKPSFEEKTRFHPHIIMKQLLQLNVILVLLFLYAPVVALVVFSFNAAEHTAVWKGFTFDWYAKLLGNRDLWRACLVSLIVAGFSTFVATAIGTMAALAIERHQFPLRSVFIQVIFLPIIVPDIVMGIALLMFYAQAHIPLGIASIIIAHVAFNISYVTIIVRARLQGF